MHFYSQQLKVSKSINQLHQLESMLFSCKQLKEIKIPDNLQLHTINTYIFLIQIFQASQFHHQ